jgi:hypothetical protein
VLFRSAPNRFLGAITSVVFALDVDPTTLEAVAEPKIITTWPGRMVEAIKGRGPNGVIVNHSQVNPKDPDHYCYAHEFGGVRTDGSLLLTRCWENRHGIDRPLDVPIDLATYEKRQICPDSDLRPSHITVSPDEKWIAADKWGGDQPAEDGLFNSGIILIEAATGKLELICTFLRGAGHPRHPHPNFSPDGTKIAFVVSDGPDTSQVAYVDIGDLIRGPAPGRGPR